jgi:hypothetical protein
VTFAIVIVVAIAIFAAAVWMANLIGMPVPDEPDPDDVTEVDVPYVCTVCGMRLTVTHAQDDEAAAPRHCREEMIPA